MPNPGVGGNGTASEFGDLTGMNRQEVHEFLCYLGAKVKGPTTEGFIEYKFPDRSKLTIRPNGEVTRTPAPIYSRDGSRINKGLRLDKDGSLLQTRDEFGNLILNTHNTGEKLND